MPKLAITISPPPRYKYIDKANPNRMLYDDDQSQIKSILSYNKIYTYIIFPEFDNGRLHYHGIITVNNTQYIRFHKHAIHKLRGIGFVDISILLEFKNCLRQSVYMMKEWGFTKAVLEISYPIIARRDKAYHLQQPIPQGIELYCEPTQAQRERLEKLNIKIEE